MPAITRADQGCQDLQPSGTGRCPQKTYPAYEQALRTSETRRKKKSQRRYNASRTVPLPGGGEGLRDSGSPGYGHFACQMQFKAVRAPAATEKTPLAGGGQTRRQELRRALIALLPSTSWCSCALSFRLAPSLPKKEVVLGRPLLKAAAVATVTTSSGAATAGKPEEAPSRGTLSIDPLVSHNSNGNSALNSTSTRSRTGRPFHVISRTWIRLAYDWHQIPTKRFNSSAFRAAKASLVVIKVHVNAFPASSSHCWIRSAQRQRPLLL